jgi:hypothetical protein
MPDDPLVFLALTVIVFAVAAWAGWTVAARRDRTPPALPDTVWLCEACRSYNDPTHLTCYRCHRARPIDAREVVPDRHFHVAQQLGRRKDSTQLGASRPWLAGEEPLRDAWLTGRDRSDEPAPPPAEPGPAASAPDGTDGPA